MAMMDVENVNHPGTTRRVDSVKYEAMKAAMLAVLPDQAPGMTVMELKAGVLSRLPDDVFPGGATAGWWLKGVQLDLEAKGVIARHATPPSGCTGSRARSQKCERFCGQIALQI